ncbi:MAG: DUF2141 domain-containing protein [Cyclobacteriaceae bacterium]|nr:DUF2141 domain-containing protein [Cyclobacteriaceae bacterium]
MEIIFFWLMLSLNIQSTSEARLTVIVENINEAKGMICVGLFDRESGFLKSTVDKKIARADGATVTVTFDNLPAGDYAVSVIHDTNNNLVLDKNFLGIPKEGFGFSNNVIGIFGPPSFEQALINLVDVKELRIKLKYY